MSYPGDRSRRDGAPGDPNERAAFPRTRRAAPPFRKPKAPEGPPPEGRLVCGLQPVREVIRAHGGRTLRVIVEHGDSPTLEAVARFATDHAIVVERASRAELERLASGARHQGVVAFAPELVVHTSTAELGLEGAPLFLCLDELEDPQNFGAIVRSAVAFSASAIVWPAHHSAPLSAATFRASAGAIEHATLVRVPALPTELATLKERGVEVIGLDADAKHALADLELEGPLAIVVGSEGKGLRKPVKQACTRLARLPMSRSIGSLNASVAAAIALYEVTRQRRPKEP